MYNNPVRFFGIVANLKIELGKNSPTSCFVLEHEEWDDNMMCYLIGITCKFAKNEVDKYD